MSVFFVLTLSTIIAIAMQASRVVLPLYMLDLGSGPAAIGVLATTYSVLPVIFSVPAGRLADRYGARWLMVGTGTAGGFALMLPYFVGGIAAAYAVGAITGLTLGIYHVMVQNLVGQLSTDANRTRNFNNYSLSNSAANLIGPLIAGFSIEWFGHTVACLFTAGIMLIPTVLLLVWGARMPKGQPKATRAPGGVTDMLHDTAVRRVLLASGILHLGQDIFRMYLPVYAYGIGFSASLIGILLSLNSAAAFLVRVFLSRMVARIKEAGVLVFSFYTGAICLLLLPLFEQPALLGLVAFAFGFGMGAGQPVITMLMYGNSPKGRSGEAMGLRMTVVFMTRLVGPLAFGAFASVAGLLAMFWSNAALMGVGGAMKYVGNKRP